MPARDPPIGMCSACAILQHISPRQACLGIFCSCTPAMCRQPVPIDRTAPAKLELECAHSQAHVRRSPLSTMAQNFEDARMDLLEVMQMAGEQESIFCAALEKGKVRIAIAHYSTRSSLHVHARTCALWASYGASHIHALAFTLLRVLTSTDTGMKHPARPGTLSS
jgi:hypothetical protein